MNHQITNTKMAARRVCTVAMQAAFVACAATAHADDDKKIFSFSGFGTLGAVHSSLSSGDYVADQFQPKGAGASASWSSSVDSKFAFQVDAHITDQLSSVVQIIARQQTNNTFSPRIEWANVKYAFTPDLSVRIGRTALPIFASSETRLVGFSNPWIRPPIETYSLNSITNADGIDVSYRHSFGAVKNTTQVWYGTTKVDVVSGNGAVLSGLKATSIKGIANTIEHGALTARVSAVKSAFELPITATYKLNFESTVINLGATYDPGDWFIQGEVSHSKLAPVARAQMSAFVTAGYRWKSWTPYASYSRIKPADDLTQLALIQQSTASLGVRWDVRKNMDLKVQLDRVSVANGSIGYFTNAKPALAGKSANVVSVSLDYVF
jgi:hypothetical protein